MDVVSDYIIDNDISENTKMNLDWNEESGKAVCVCL
jgi:hypothetical protein